LKEKIINRKVYLTIGLIASGKSTWAKQFVKNNPNTQRVSRDDFRFMTTNYTYTSENEKIVDILYKNSIATLIFNTDKDIILDEQNLDKDRREKFKEWILSLSKNIKFIEKEFPVELSVAIKRDSKREFSIGASIIKKIYHKYEIELKQMIERHKPKIEYNKNIPWACIFDIDGTLSNSSQRKIFDFKECINDKVIGPVAYILKAIVTHKWGIAVIIVSGREEICRKETEEWLRKNNIYYTHLYMRKEKDYRDDTIVKKEIYDEYIKDNYNIDFVVDDRPSVIQMWIDMGLYVFNCNQDPYCRNDF
jgi:predicted kinase